MKKEQIDLVVIIPVGPGTNPYFLLDTIKSIKHYCTKNHRIILINDSQKKLNAKILKEHPLEIVTPKSMGKQSGLYFSLCMGLEYAEAHFNYQVLLRMDDDALITGNRPESDAIKHFREHPELAMLGSYRFTWNSEPRNFSPPRNQIIKETSLLWPIINALRKKHSKSYKSILVEAKQNGYELGEHVLGGVYFLSKTFVHKLNSRKLLSATQFIGSRLEEDHIFGMLAYCVNMRLGDFVTGDKPMCLKWRGMPAHPEKIIDMGKKVIHSTRYFEDLDEEQVRIIFRKCR